MTTAASPSVQALPPKGGPKVIDLSRSPSRRQTQQSRHHVESVVSGVSFRDLEPGSRPWEEALVESLAGQFSPDEIRVIQNLAVIRGGITVEGFFFLCRLSGGLDQKAALDLRATLSSMQLLKASTGQGGPSEYKLHATVARAVVNLMDDKTRQEMHGRAAAWYRKPYVDRADEAMPAIVGKAAPLWRDKNLNHFEGATEEEWQASPTQIPASHVERLRNACLQEYLTAAVTRGDKSSIVWNVENALALHYHLAEGGRPAEAAQIELLILDPLERWGRLEEVCDILKGRAAAESGAERIATLERMAGHLQKLQRWDEALPLAREIHGHCARLRDKPREIKSLQRLRDLWRQKGALDEALDAQKKILAIEIKRENKDGRMQAHQEMSVLHMIRGRTGNVKSSILSRFQIYTTFFHSNSDMAQAIIHSRQAERLAKRLCDTQARARALHQRGRVMDYFGQIATAEKFYIRALELRRQIADDEGVADSLQEIGKTYLASAHALLVQGRHGHAHVFFNKAQRCFLDSVEIFRALNQQDKVKIVSELMESTVMALDR